MLANTAQTVKRRTPVAAPFAGPLTLAPSARTKEMQVDLGFQTVLAGAFGQSIPQSFCGRTWRHAEAQIGVIESMPRKRQLPYLKKLAQRGKVGVWLVDGAWLRTNIEQEWDNFGHHYGDSFIPENEIWLDVQAHPDEQQFFIAHALLERRLLARGVDEETARQKANQAEIEARRKAGDLKEIRQDGHLANPEAMHVTLWKKLTNGVSVWIVDGRRTRSVFDVEFTAGGHDHVYEWIPQNEVWIDDDITDAERPYVLLHELHERNIMEQGMDYDHAHQESSKLELYHRHHPEELHAALAKEGWE